MKKLFLTIVACILLISLASCEKQNNVVEENAQVVADAFTDCDMITINKIIFGADEIVVDEKLSDIWGENDESQEGILEHIFKHVTLRVKRTTENVIEYEIKAPDMTNVFVDINVDMTNITENELLQYIKDYTKNAEIKTTIISLEYILVDEKPIVNYKDEIFINAVTGGLLDAYKELYSEMMERVY